MTYQEHRSQSGLWQRSVIVGALCTLVSLDESSGSAEVAKEPKAATVLSNPLGKPVRGATIGPIENGYHPNRGYGSSAFERTLDEVSAMGGNWIALTVFGRVYDLSGQGVDPTFESPVETNRRDVARAVAQAHARGLRVLLVPHLWIESGEWRGKLNPGGDREWSRWADSYRRFVLAWAKVAEASKVDLLAAGVELRTWATTPRAPSFLQIIDDIRATYKGMLTYSANWDEAEDDVIWGKLDVIGVNAFYPLAERKGATLTELKQGARKHAEKLGELAQKWQKPILFSEIGYTTRPDPALDPWEWPDHMSNVRVTETDQARAYHALLSETLHEPWFAGFLCWRFYADPDDVSQESEWGFSPRGKLAELTLRDAFRHQSPTARKGLWPIPGAIVPGLYP
jgi:hypothetical protein